VSFTSKDADRLCLGDPLLFLSQDGDFLRLNTRKKAITVVNSNWINPNHSFELPHGVLRASWSADSSSFYAEEAHIWKTQLLLLLSINDTKPPFFSLSFFVCYVLDIALLSFSSNRPDFFDHSTFKRSPAEKRKIIQLCCNACMPSKKLMMITSEILVVEIILGSFTIFIFGVNHEGISVL